MTTLASPFRLAALIAVISAPSVFAAAPAARLNDTGITQCMARNGDFRDFCKGSPQDAGSGRDAIVPSDADGHAGFMFTKLGADGSTLPADAAAWSCIQDRVTGLVWEMKTTDGGLHDMNAKFTNFGDGSAGDSSAFVAAVNQQALCGRSDWRLPARGELQGIVDYSVAYPGPTVDAAWFPNSDGYSFWTSTPQAESPAVSWYVNFQTGYTAVLSNSYEFGLVRVVSGAAPSSSGRYTVVGSGDEVADNLTGLIWQRCSVGQAWDGAACAGKATKFNWGDALQEAQSIAGSTGQKWRTPNTKELASLNADGVSDPSIDAAAFPNTPSELYWSSTPSYSAPLNAWTVYTFDGSVTPQVTAGRYMLRLVRPAGRAPAQP
jgi:hypothetical protein